MGKRHQVLDDQESRNEESGKKTDGRIGKRLSETKGRKIKAENDVIPYRRKFCEKWLHLPEVRDWIYPLKNEPMLVWCKFCKTKIRAHLTDLKIHNKTLKHKRNVGSLRPEVPRDVFKVEHDTHAPSSPKQVFADMADVENSDVTSTEMADREVLNPANIGFIGCGNMAQALLKAFVKEGLVDPSQVVASAPSDRNLSKIRPMGVKTTNDNNRVVCESDMVFLCVKPHLLADVIEGLDPLERNHNPLFVSVITGFDLHTLEQMLSSIVDTPRVVRTMPNTPCMVGQGCCVYTLGRFATSGDGSVMNSMLKSVGVSAQVPEYQIDAACGLAGSGPAYIYAAIEALADGGVKMGLPRHLAQTLAAQTVKGAATMVMETGKHPGQLKDEVCSPGGTTITAMHVLERNGLRNALISAVEASANRSKELGKK
ncbi:uncharacterized protein LOC134775684 isoform X2 [Penaeus indicus]|uniref:uncharacterized protein LOC134775684 isoform X2 n=1 Tax=Penaeus indicus TaxID=29960 RepID=UPI00300D47E4